MLASLRACVSIPPPGFVPSFPAIKDVFNIKLQISLGLLRYIHAALSAAFVPSKENADDAGDD